ncbi:MAG: hypothetical protein A4E69_01053 [Syntrophus sp. PtaB.Bin138]|nr:MAG: hypothetical protein A4E69_01053 [Syntrophus sp. PtaB.Bin138]
MGIITDIIKALPITAIQKEKLLEQEKRLEALETENLLLKEKLRRFETGNLARCPKCSAVAYTLSGKEDSSWAAVGCSDFVFACNQCGFSETVLASSTGDAWRQVRERGV